MGVVRVKLESGFEGVNCVNEPVLLGGATSPNRTGDLGRAVGAVKSLTDYYVLILKSRIARASQSESLTLPLF